MSSVKIKICGMRDAENILQVAEAHPDYLGFIFYKQSPRYVGSTFYIPSGLGEVQRVGVFVNESLENVLSYVDQHQLDLVQLHGHESSEYCAALQAQNIKVIKAFGIDDQFEFNSVKPYEDSVDFFLFDTKGRNFGGNGFSFRWEKLQGYTGMTPFFLSGGLSLVNVTAALELQHPLLFALDLNSGVEVQPGLKNVESIKQIIAQRNLMNREIK